MQNYTKNGTFKDLEPKSVIPYDADHNPFKVEAAANRLAYECSRKRAEMITIESLAEKPLMIKTMKTLNQIS